MRERIHGVLDANPFKHFVIERLLRSRVGKELTILGSENLEKARKLKNSGAALIFFPNHLSHADGPVLDLALRKLGYTEIVGSLYFMQGSVIDGNLITKFLVTAYQVISIPSQRLEVKDPVKRTKLKNRAHSAAMEVLNTGGALGVLAQGSRSRDKKLHPEQVNPNTAIYLDMAPNTYIIPVGIVGTEEILKPGKFFPSKGKVTIIFGEPVSALELKQQAILADSENVNAKIMENIMGRISALLPEEYR